MIRSTTTTWRCPTNLHLGNPEAALANLTAAIDADDANVAAHALRLIAYIWCGDWESWWLNVDDVLEMSPRPEYERLDSLFLAYARIYVDYEDAAKELECILEDNETWFIPRVLMAATWGHAAAAHENREYAKKALSLLATPELIVTDAPIVMLTSMGVYLPAVSLLGEEQPELQEKARAVAERLAAYPNSPIFAHMRALYYQSIDDQSMRELAVRDLLRTGSGVLLEHAMAASYEVGDVQAVLDVEADGFEPTVARAYVLAMSPDQGDRQQALQIFERLEEQHETWYARHKLIQIPLILGKLKEAQSVCRDWIESSVGLAQEGNWLQRSIRFIARGGSDQTFQAEEADAPARFFEAYQRAFLELSKGKRADAISHFTTASRWCFPDERRLWAYAFAVNLSRDTDE